MFRWHAGARREQQLGHAATDPLSATPAQGFRAHQYGMTGSTEPAAESDPPRDGSAASPAEAINRRRPGRREDVAPELTPLLRYRAPTGAEDLDAPDLGVSTQQVCDVVDDLSTARGIITGLLIGALFWIAIALFFML